MLGHRVDDRAEGHVVGIHPAGPLPQRGPPPRGPHHLVCDAAAEQGVGSAELAGPESHGFGVGGKAGFVVDAAVKGGVDAVAEGLGMVGFLRLEGRLL